MEKFIVGKKYRGKVSEVVRKCVYVGEKQSVLENPEGKLSIFLYTERCYHVELPDIVTETLWIKETVEELYANDHEDGGKVLGKIEVDFEGKTPVAVRLV